MPLPKKKSIVSNNYWKLLSRKFFAMCRSCGQDGEQTKKYYLNLLDAERMQDLTDSQWEFIFSELEAEIKKQAEKEHAIFVKDMDEALKEIFGD